MSSLLRPAALAAFIFVLPAVAAAGDFIDTRLAFVIADDNLFAGPGETNPNSPGIGFRAGNQNRQFYDNFNTRYAGFETMSFLTLYKSTPTFFEGLFAEAAFTVRMLQRPSGQLDFRDNSSYIRLWYKPSTWGENENISLTAFPVDADRMRLGYLYRITWGGSGVFTNRAFAQGVPGAKVQITRDRWYAYAGVKTAILFNDLLLEEQTYYGAIAGVGMDVTENLRLEANGGYFQKGINPLLAADGIRAPVDSVGVSGHAVWHVGAPVGTSVDLRLYRNDPDLYQRFFNPEKYPGGFSYSIEAEVDYLRQTLGDPNVAGRTVIQPALAGAINARAKYNFFRFHLLGLYRTVSYIQFDVPGFPPYQDFPAGTEQQPEMFVAGGLDYHFPRLHLTPGFILGVQQVAAFTPPSDTGLGGNNPPASLQGGRTVVLRDANDVAVLPLGEDPLPGLLGQGHRPLGHLGDRRRHRRALLHARSEPSDLHRRRDGRGPAHVPEAGRARLQPAAAGAVLVAARGAGANLPRPFSCVAQGPLRGPLSFRGGGRFRPSDRQFPAPVEIAA